MDHVTFLRDVLLLLLDKIPLGICRCMWFQHDGAPGHAQRNDHQYLDDTFTNQWIGRSDPVSWPASSPDLSHLDFLLCHNKAFLYETPVESEMDLVARIEVAAGDVVGNH